MLLSALHSPGSAPLRGRTTCTRECWGQLVDGTFLHDLEFMIVIAYGFLSSVSCLAAVEVDDPTDLLDGPMWGECGPVTMVR